MGKTEGRHWLTLQPEGTAANILSHFLSEIGALNRNKTFQVWLRVYISFSSSHFARLNSILLFMCLFTQVEFVESLDHLQINAQTVPSPMYFKYFMQLLKNQDPENGLEVRAVDLASAVLGLWTG